MTYFTDEYLDVIFNEGFKARVEFGDTTCPYENPIAADAWWAGFERAMEDEGVFND